MWTLACEEAHLGHTRSNSSATMDARESSYLLGTIQRVWLTVKLHVSTVNFQILISFLTAFLKMTGRGAWCSSPRQHTRLASNRAHLSGVLGSKASVWSNFVPALRWNSLKDWAFLESLRHFVYLLIYKWVDLNLKSIVQRKCSLSLLLRVKMKVSTREKPNVNTKEGLKTGERSR